MREIDPWPEPIKPRCWLPWLLGLWLFAVESAAAGVLHRGLGPGPDSLDVHRAQSLSALNVLRDLHEGLVTFDARAGLIPGIARSWSVSDDGLTWTFRLDREARWSDGTRVTAGDFVRGWRRALAPATASPTAGLLDGVAAAADVRRGHRPPDALGVRAIDDDRLEVQLERPIPWFAELLTHPVTYPWPGPIARYSGPFILEETVPGAHLRLRARANWRAADSVALDAVVWHVIEEPNVELARYRAGQLHVTETIPPGRVDWLRDKFGTQLRIAPYLGTFYLVFNLSRPPFDESPGLRRALSLVIDRDILVERVLGSGELPAWGLLPPGMPGWPERRAPPLAAEQRLAEARRLYAAAGHGADNPLTVELRFNSSLTHRRLAAAVAAMWKAQLGVQTRLIHEEWKVFVANRRQGRVTEVMRGGWIADWRDAANFLDLFRSDSPMNYAFFDDARYDQLLQRAEGATGRGRIDLLREAESRLLEQQVVIPLYYYVSRHLVDPDVSGFEDNPMDIHLSRWLSIQ